MKKPVVHTHKLLDIFYKYALAAVLVFIPLYPKFPLFSLPFTYVQIRAEDFLIAAVWGIFFLRLLVKKSYKFPPLSFQIGIFFVIGILSSISAIFITKNIIPTAVILHLFRRVEYISIFFLVYEASRSEENRRYFFELFLIPLIGVFFYGLAQIFLGAPVISTMNVESSKGAALTLRPGVPLSSTFAGHYDLSVYLTFMLTIFTALLCTIKNRFKMILTFVAFLATLWLFMRAGSRIGLLGLFLGITLVSFLYKKYIVGAVLIITMFAFIATAPGYIDRFKSIINIFTAKLSFVIKPPVYAVVPTPTPTPNPEILRPLQQDTSTSIRFDVEWPRALRSFYKNPLLGTGYSSISLSTDNDYLRSLGETGLLGFLAFISVIIGLFIKLIKRFPKQVGQEKLISISAIGILVVFSTAAIFLDVFESSKIAILFWAYMGLSLSTKS